MLNMGYLALERGRFVVYEHVNDLDVVRHDVMLHRTNERSVGCRLGRLLAELVCIAGGGNSRCPLTMRALRVRYNDHLHPHPY
jgi:hypothetical protein